MPIAAPKAAPGDAQDIGLDQRISEAALEDCACRGQGCAYDHCQEDSGNSEFPNDGVMKLGDAGHICKGRYMDQYDSIDIGDGDVIASKGYRHTDCDEKKYQKS